MPLKNQVAQIVAKVMPEHKPTFDNPVILMPAQTPKPRPEHRDRAERAHSEPGSLTCTSGVSPGVLARFYRLAEEGIF